MRCVTAPEQRINLLPRRSSAQGGVFPGFATVAWVIAIGLVGLLTAYLVMAWQINDLRSVHQRVASQAAAYREQLGRLEARLPDKEPDPLLVAELQRLQDSQAQVIRATELIRRHGERHRAGFARFFRGLARHPVEGLWLSDIRLAGDGSALTIKGRTLKAELVPRLIQSLGNEPVFSGRTFRELRFERPADETGGALFFELQSGRESGDAG